LTLVNQDPTIPALQVKNNEGNWIWAKPIPGTFVVNIGDMLKIWTNGLYQSTLHRVMNDDSKYRVSVPFFYEPNFDALVEPLEICEQQTGSAVPRFTPVVYGDHVIGKVLTNFG
jgi:isopenicillin N synthase-like dioxygenase